MTTDAVQGRRSGARPATGHARWTREIVLVLVVKTLAMAAIWSVWFSGPTRHGASAEDVAERVYSSAPPTPQAAPQGASHARP